MRNYVLFFISALVFCGCTSTSELTAFQDTDRAWTTKNIIQKGQTLAYEQGGHFWCRTRSLDNEDRLNGEKKVRDFIWEHFTNKKLGYIKFSCAHIDTSNTTHYFIEPNEKGDWNIVRRGIYQDSDMNFRFEDDSLSSVERFQSNDPNDWVLISKTQNGEIIERLPLY